MDAPPLTWKNARWSMGFSNLFCFCRVAVTDSAVATSCTTAPPFGLPQRKLGCPAV
ncbi:hypothetical protein PR003_g8593 [Phytophthora rubi]|uniref:Uncharacterized protein n=1 Tax=Phytophthora rubi TaxID=129364 RepID=A0A6A4FKK2_9STRA|nr:hypothetical protein PR002_g4796 [Phytophthora rubi]KAE9046396.1 hypothetical protein PR001_g4572 [Phytophthora rubi]KAE9344177.1 hypothetical protein PR003_g8593 [Phytophthora rubi]